MLYVDQEAMRVTAAPVNPTDAVPVERGWDGTGTQAHSTSALVYVAIPQYFTYIGLQGPCNAAAQVALPVINDWSGAIYDCQSGVWVNTLQPMRYRAMARAVPQQHQAIWTRVLRALHLAK